MPEKHDSCTTKIKKHHGTGGLLKKMDLLLKSSKENMKNVRLQIHNLFRYIYSCEKQKKFSDSNIKFRIHNLTTLG